MPSRRSGGQARSAIDPQEMHEKMLSAMREDRSVRAASRRHRDEFLRSQIRLIETFCARTFWKSVHVALGKMEIVLKPLSLVNADVTTTLPMW